ncbi:hypothetical protein GOBAR_AA14799 [Gossypium barbadense]|uniref:Uncharacterized protein n=1 Tax=Gossypium barbadense TaxID=3634 RepID=A0A2P5XRC3_GOSBA|nr:hypothetical protein GOBAR_AA14799 [Gossypium barbadense]
MGCDKSPRPCDMAVGELHTYTGVGLETHGRARDKAKFYFFDTDMRHARTVKPWIIIHGRGTLTWAGEKRTTLGTRPRTQAWENSQARPKIAKFETHRLTLITLDEISHSPLPDPYSQPPLPSHPVHGCQHLPISLPIPPREPSSDEDV